jgi:hypothetical protein
MGDPSRDEPIPHPAVEELDGEIGPKDLQRFVTVLRGYDRIEVDECLRRIAASVGELRAELSTRRQAPPDPETRPVASDPVASDPVASDPVAPDRAAADRAAADQMERSFGVRAERLLRLAETEARDMRAGAAQEATALVERARADAERIRHEMEQAMIERSSARDREHAKRMSEVQQLEKQVAGQLGEIGREADEARAALRREVDAARAQVQAELAQARERAAAEIAQQKDAAGVEVERLETLSAAAHGELRRLVDVLVRQLGDG